MKKIFTIFFFIYISLFITGCDEDYVWKTTSNGRIWIEKKYSDYEYRWEGNTLEGVAYGPGKLKLRKGNTEFSKDVQAYYGSFSPESRKISVNNDTIIGSLDDDGNITGFAVTISPSGDVCIGNFLKHKPNGYLAYRKDGVTLYRGEWKEGLRDGNAEECDNSLKCKKTIWSKDKRKIGQNYSVKTDAGIYVGDISFDDGIPTANGYGKHITSQDTLEGYWEKNTLTGPIVYKNNDFVYEGDFVDGFMNGFGTFKWKNKNIFFGNYKQDLKHGFGIFIWSFDPLNAYIGFWENDKQIGIGNKVFNNKEKFVYWKEGKKHLF